MATIIITEDEEQEALDFLDRIEKKSRNRKQEKLRKNLVLSGEGDSDAIPKTVRSAR